MIRQRTIKRIIRAAGMGFHTGRRFCVTLRPGAADSGILFRRVDLRQPAEVEASLENTWESSAETILEQDGIRISNSGHLLAALAGMGIDNVCVDLTGPEVPVIGGGAGPFAYLVQSAGIREQDVPRRFLRVRQRVIVEDGERYALLEPFDGFRISLDDARDQAGLGLESHYSAMDFAAAPLVSGMPGAFALENGRNSAVGQSTLPESETMKSDYREAFLKQRLLISLGDLSLLGRSLIGRFSGRGTGRALNNRLLRKLLADESAWEEVIFDPDCLEAVPG